MYFYDKIKGMKKQNLKTLIEELGENGGEVLLTRDCKYYLSETLTVPENITLRVEVIVEGVKFNDA